MRTAKIFAVTLASFTAVVLPDGAEVETAEANVASEAVREELSPLAFLVGFCWAGAFPDGQRTDTHCFDGVFDGVFVRDRHSVVGGSELYEGETLYNWNGERGLIEYTYWNSLGGVSRGTVAPTDRGLSFPDESYEGPDGEKIEISSYWEPRGNAAFESVTVEKPPNGEARERRVRYEKRPFAKTPER